MAAPNSNYRGQRVHNYIWNEKTGKFIGWDGVPRNPSDFGDGKDGLKVTDTDSHLLEEILVELKKMNQHFTLLTEVEFTTINIEE